MDKGPATALLLPAAAAQAWAWWFCASVMLRTQGFDRPVAEPMWSIGLTAAAAVGSTLVAFVVGRRCWQRQGAGSALTWTGVLCSLTFFFLTWFGWVWELRSGHPFGLREWLRYHGFWFG